MPVRTRSAVCVFAFALALALPLFAAHAGEARHVFKMATLAPKGIGWSKAWEEILAPAILKATEGGVSFKTYYGGIMGDEEDYIKKMRIGQLQAASVTAQVAPLICPPFTVLELPFLFENYDEVDYVRERLYPLFDKYFADKGFALIYWFDQDFDQIYSVNHRLDTLEDFTRARFLTWYGPVEEATFLAMGVDPIPINGPEVPAALRQGVVDSVIAPSIWVVGTQTYSILRFVNTAKIRYAPGVNIWSLDAWKGLPEASRQKVLTTRGSALREFITVTRDANQRGLEALLKYGVKPAHMAPEQLAIMKDKTHKVWSELSGKLYPPELLDRVTALLREFRQKAAK
ncbi:MAG: TRAP transporter substrate-binding protein DctP [Thermodesulfobacteriota bacterium]